MPLGLLGICRLRLPPAQDGCGELRNVLNLKWLALTDTSPIDFTSGSFGDFLPTRVGLTQVLHWLSRPGWQGSACHQHLMRPFRVEKKAAATASLTDVDQIKIFYADAL